MTVLQELLRDAVPDGHWLLAAAELGLSEPTLRRCRRGERRKLHQRTAGRLATWLSVRLSTRISLEDVLWASTQRGADPEKARRLGAHLFRRQGDR